MRIPAYFFTLYQPLADDWRLYDATQIAGPTLVAAGGAGLVARVRGQQTWKMASEGFDL